MRSRPNRSCLVRRAVAAGSGAGAIESAIVSAGSESDNDVPEAFARAVRSLRKPKPEAGITVEEAVAPTRIAPYAFALHGQAGPDKGGRPAQGKLIVLHDPEGQPGWDGVLRLVAYLTVDLDVDDVTHPLAADVAWSWLTDSLAAARAGHGPCAGTVSCMSSVRCGALADHGEFSTASNWEAALQLRASWTPDDSELSAHARAWHLLLTNGARLANRSRRA